MRCLIENWESINCVISTEHCFRYSKRLMVGKGGQGDEAGKTVILGKGAT